MFKCPITQGTFDNQSVSIHGKLWKSVKNGYRLEKERKDGKSNRICGKNEKVHEEAGTVLVRIQKEIKRQADRGRKEAEVWKVGDKVMLSTKDLVFKEQLVRKLVD